MSDLHALLTVEAQRQAPERVPPFEDILDRARRRRYARAAVAACSAVAVAVAAIVVVSTVVIPAGGRHDAPAARPSPTAGPKGGAVLLPTDHWRPGDGAMLAAIAGKLIIGTRGEAVCAWIGTRHTAILWPEGYAVRTQPPELIDPGGRVIAHAGDRIGSGGGGDTAKSTGPCNGKGQWTFSVQGGVHVLAPAHNG
jgi:hypothetical protein